jgi:hypothetical protein
LATRYTCWGNKNKHEKKVDKKDRERTHLVTHLVGACSGCEGWWWGVGSEGGGFNDVFHQLPLEVYLKEGASAIAAGSEFHTGTILGKKLNSHALT